MKLSPKRLLFRISSVVFKISPRNKSCTQRQDNDEQMDGLNDKQTQINIHHFSLNQTKITHNYH